MKPIVRLLPFTLPLLMAALAACPSGGTSYDIPSADGGSRVPPHPTPATNTCEGDATACIHGSLDTKGFKSSFLFARAYLYSLFPNGQVHALGEADGGDGGNEIADDNTFAFSHVDPGSHYYLRVVGRFDPSDTASTVETIAGPLTIPSTAPIKVFLRPVSLEALQERLAGASATTLATASAKVFDPKTGHALEDAAVTLEVAGQSLTMPYGTGPSGANSYSLALPAGTPGGTSFTIQTVHASMGTIRWNLAGELPSGDGVIDSPHEGDAVPLQTALPVEWEVAPFALHSIVQVFFKDEVNKKFVQTYQSPALFPLDVTHDTVPAESIKDAGGYLLNVLSVKTTCPVDADGCVHNASVAGANITTK